MTSSKGRSPSRRLIDTIAFHASFVLLVASPWILACSGVFDIIDALCNWRESGYENLGYWLGYRA